jgi:hypothetical protein
MLANNVHMHSKALERDRIALQIRAVMVPYRHELRNKNSGSRADYLLRAGRLLDALDIQALPFPDLGVRLSAARAELGLG